MNPPAPSRDFPAFSIFPACLTLICLFALGGCRDAEAPAGETHSPEALPAREAEARDDVRWWFTLQEGGLRTSQRPAPTSERAPWTVRPRIVDFAAAEAGLYAAVNGYGLVKVDWSGGQAPRFRYLYDFHLLRYRTLTRVLVVDNALLCHCYFNTQLNVIAAEEWDREVVSLIRYRVSGGASAEGAGEAVPLPFQKTHPGWELKTLYAAAGGYLYLEWKRSEPWRTEFSYSRLSLDDWREVGVTRDAFRRAYWSQDVDRELRSAGEWLAGRMGQERTYHFRVRGEDSTAVKRLRIGASAVDIWRIPLQRVGSPDGASWIYGLDPRGTVYRIGPSPRGSRERCELPPLPGGFTYSDFYVVPAGVIAAWEESDFIHVGSAGLLFLASPGFTEAAETSSTP